MSDNEWIIDPAFQMAGFEHAAGVSTIGWRRRADRSKNCIANDNTCKGFKSKGTDYCIGHLRAIAKAQEATE